MKKTLLTLIGIIFLLTAQACAHPMFYKAKEFSGTVVDADTNKPLEGVVVVAQWILFEANLASGGHKGVIEVYEAITDKDGKYTIPGWGPKMRPTTSYLDHYDPQIFIFKKGHQYLTLINTEKERFYNYFSKVNDWGKVDFEDFKGKVEGTTFDSYKSLRESVWDGRAIKLKKFKGSNEELFSMLNSVYGNVLTIEDQGWSLKKVKYTVKEWNEAIKDLKSPFNYREMLPQHKKVLEEEFND